ncbi:hypothetical protein BKA70DRAFT_1356328 [Coprinopsis sp. MPI-PUGE-AT-0042]|nr:hypothetical protein BKA70DRAFT_1356328 [Coprinopsis sp. MPI-PUGE-AT-0042]
MDEIKALDRQPHSSRILSDCSNVSISGGNLISAGRDIIYNVQIARNAQEFQVSRMLDWLSPRNYRQIQATNWTPNTVPWFLSGTTFGTWLTTQGSIICRNRNASAAVRHAQELVKAAPDETSIAFVYLRYTDPISAVEVVAAIIRQMIEDHIHLRSFLEPLYAQHVLYRTFPTQQELLSLLKTLSGHFKRNLRFIDGLDEAHIEHRSEILSILATLDGNLMVTSRPLSLLGEVLEGPQVTFIKINAYVDDIERMTSKGIDHNASLRRLLLRHNLKEKVVSRICAKFLYASLQLKMIKHCTNRKTSLIGRTLVDENELISVRLVRFCHHTTRKPLVSLLAKIFLDPHAVLAQGCILYLDALKMNDITIEQWSTFDNILNSTPFLGYAPDKLELSSSPVQRTFVYVKASRSFSNSISLRGEEKPFDLATSPIHIAAFVDTVYLLDSSSIEEEVSHITQRRSSALFLAASQGNHQSLEHLLRLSHIHVNARNSQGKTALHAALLPGLKGLECLEALLTHPAININARDSTGESTSMPWTTPETRLSPFVSGEQISPLQRACSTLSNYAGKIHGIEGQAITQELLQRSRGMIAMAPSVSSSPWAASKDPSAHVA